MHIEFHSNADLLETDSDLTRIQFRMAKVTTEADLIRTSFDFQFQTSRSFFTSVQFAARCAFRVPGHMMHHLAGSEY